MKLALAAVLIIATAVPGVARTVTVTGDHGGTMTRTRTCQPQAGQIHCSGQVVLTGRNGAAANADFVTTFSKDKTVRSITGTTGNGRSFSRTTTISR